MSIAALAICVLLEGPAAFQEQGGDPELSEQRIAATCRTLESAFSEGKSFEETQRALRSAVEVVHPRVIGLIDEKGLRHADPKVRSASIETLSRMDHRDALKALSDALKRDRKDLEKAPPLYAAYLRGIARHGKEESIPCLVEDLFQSPDRGVITARILGLGRIRSRTSVDELIRLMRSCPRPRVGEYMGEFRLALVVLTGEDKGTDQELWINWYGDHKNTLAVAAEPPELPRELARRWNTYWGENPDEKPAKKRGRGK